MAKGKQTSLSARHQVDSEYDNEADFEFDTPQPPTPIEDGNIVPSVEFSKLSHDRSSLLGVPIPIPVNNIWASAVDFPNLPAASASSPSTKVAIEAKASKTVSSEDKSDGKVRNFAIFKKKQPQKVPSPARNRQQSTFLPEDDAWGWFMDAPSKPGPSLSRKPSITESKASDVDFAGSEKFVTAPSSPILEAVESEIEICLDLQEHLPIRTTMTDPPSSLIDRLTVNWKPRSRSPSPSTALGSHPVDPNDYPDLSIMQQQRPYSLENAKSREDEESEQDHQTTEIENRPPPALAARPPTSNRIYWLSHRL